MNNEVVSLGDRMKTYEADQGQDRLNPAIPYIIRIDGHNFSTFTRGFQKPWDTIFAQAMVNTAVDLVHEFKAVTGYTQSDEITLVFMPIVDEKTKSARIIPFNGRIMKLASLIAGFTSARFNYHLANKFAEQSSEQALTDQASLYSDATQAKIKSGTAHFDARVFSVPREEEIFNNLLWRSRYDCRRNSISGLARNSFSNKELLHKNVDEKLAMLQTVGVDYFEMPPGFRFGTFIKKQKYQMTMINPHTDQPIEVTRTRPKIFHLELLTLNAELLTLLTTKYYPEDQTS